MFLLILAGSLFLHLSPILYVLLSGLLGVLICRTVKRNAEPAVKSSKKGE
jgi:hypothetical protein